LRDGRLYRFPTSLPTVLSSGLFGLRDKANFSRVYQALADGATGIGAYDSWLNEQKLRPRVRAAMEGLARVATYTNAPGLMAASAALDQMRLGGRGVIYADGGWSTIVAALRDKAVEAGVEIRLGAGVHRLMVEGRRVRRVLADGSEHVADAALMAVGPNEAAALAPHVASLRTHADEAIPVRANALDLALERWPEGAKEFVIGLDTPIYFSLHSRAGKLAPEGGAVVHIARYMAPHETVRLDAIEELEAVADLAMPGWRKFEKRRQTLRGITVSNALVRWDRPRPGVALSDAPGVFIAGDWVGGEGMLSDPAAASAAEASAAIAAWLAGEAQEKSAA
jgi:phytoene dehydrogenase-like protein